MKPIDVLIALFAVGIVAFSIYISRKNKKKGKTSCGCDCANCPGCSGNMKNDK